MEIFFPTAEVCDLFCRRERLDSAFGPELARLICCRLAVLRSAPVLGLISRCPPIALASVGRSETRYAVALGKAHRLEFESTAPAVGTRDGAAVTGIMIVGVRPLRLERRERRDRTP